MACINRTAYECADKKTYYPERYVYLCGQRNESTATLRGKIDDRLATLKAFSDIFSYRLYTSIDAKIFFEIPKLLHSIEKETRICNDMIVKADAFPMQKSVSAEIDSRSFSVSGTIGSICSKKETGLCASSFALDAELNAHLFRNRTIGDLVGMAIGDVSKWNLEKFYFLEV